MKKILILLAVMLSVNVEVRPESRDLGQFRVSHYCPCAVCNGGWNETALGTRITPYRTAAVDPSVIPLGSHITVDGVEYVAEDTGCAVYGNRIDLCVGSHGEAYSRGVRYTEVYLK